MLDGWVDACDDGLLTDRAARSDSGEPVTLEVLCEGTVVGTARAALFREDLLSAGIGVGRHGFEFEVPAAIRVRHTYVLSVRDADSKQELGQSPIAVDERAARVMKAAGCGASWRASIFTATASRSDRSIARCRCRTACGSPTRIRFPPRS